MNVITVLDIIDEVKTFCIEKPELLLIVISFVFILQVSLWTLMDRLGEKGWKSLLLLYRYVVLFRKVGLPAWLTVFLLIPGLQIVIMILFSIKLMKVMNRSYLFVILLFLVPVVFFPVLAFGNGKNQHVRQQHAKVVDEPEAELDPKPEPEPVPNPVLKKQESQKVVRARKEVAVESFTPPKTAQKQERVPQMPKIKNGPTGDVLRVKRLKIEAQKKDEQRREELLKKQKIQAINKPKKKVIDIVVKKNRSLKA